jgi:hypothetical protein
VSDEPDVNELAHRIVGEATGTRMMPPKFRQLLADYKQACEKTLARISVPGAVVTPGEREKLQELIGLIERVLEIDAME